MAKNRPNLVSSTQKSRPDPGLSYLFVTIFVPKFNFPGLLQDLQRGLYILCIYFLTPKVTGVHVLSMPKKDIDKELRNFSDNFHLRKKSDKSENDNKQPNKQSPGNNSRDTGKGVRRTTPSPTMKPSPQPAQQQQPPTLQAQL